MPNNYQAYERAAKKGLKEILDRLEPVTGMNRSYLATVLGNYGRKAAGREAGRTAEGIPGGVYGGTEGHLGGLRAPVREAAGSADRGDDRLSGGGLSDNGGHPGIAAEADLLLRPERKALEIKGVSTMREALASLCSQVPVQTHFEWEAVEGALQSGGFERRREPSGW
jgi:hypothetical protein